MKNTLRALRYFRADAPTAGLAAALIIVGAILGAFKPWPLSLMVDCVFSGRPAPGWLRQLSGATSPPELVPVLVLFVLLFHLVQAGISSLYTYLSIRIGLRGLTRVRHELFAKLMRLSLRFYQASRMGDIVYRATWDTYAFQTFFQQGLITFITALTSLAIMFAVMVRLDVSLAMVALGSVPVLLLVIRQVGGPMSRRAQTAQQADSQVSSTVQQDLTALSVIQSCTREPDELARFNTQNDAARDRRVSQHGVEVVYGLAIAAIFAAATAAICWVGARDVFAGRLTLGQLLVFLAYLAQFYEPLNQLSHVGATLSGASAGMSRVFEVLDSPEEISSPAPAIIPKRPLNPRGEIRFENVSFGYEESKPVLKAIDLTIRGGDSVALVGASGAGKSTLISLLPRFFDPSAGRITLDGVDLREIPLEELRRQIALVLQEPILLPTTIAENIAFSRPGATAQEIESAAMAAHAHSFISKLPQGYRTMVGDGAARLSVGEKQRLSLARAFLKDAPILLLDEPTSALDVENESLVTNSLRRLMEGRTTIVAAHRLATIQSARRVVVLDGGAIAETGTMEQLRNQGGYFSRMT